MKAHMSRGHSAPKETTLSKVLWWRQPCACSLSWTKRHSSGWTDGHPLIVSGGFSSLSWWRQAKMASMYLCLWMLSVFSSTKIALAGRAAEAGENNPASRPHVSGAPVSLQGCVALHSSPEGVPVLLWFSLLLNSHTRQHRPFRGMQLTSYTLPNAICKATRCRSRA